jgi:hypothetical protein
VFQQGGGLSGYWCCIRQTDNAAGRHLAPTLTERLGSKTASKAYVKTLQIESIYANEAQDWRLLGMPSHRHSEVLDDVSAPAGSGVFIYSVVTQAASGGHEREQLPPSGLC